MIPPDFNEALSILYARLKDAPILWAITGSLGMVLQGMDLDVHDIDLQSDDPGSRAVEALFPEYVTHPVAEKASERIRSAFGALEIAGVKVEIMGDVEGRWPDGRWEPAPDLRALIRWVEYQGMRLPVLDLSYEHTAYLRMGRAEKAAKIKAFLDRSGG